MDESGSRQARDCRLKGLAGGSNGKAIYEGVGRVMRTPRPSEADPTPLTLVGPKSKGREQGFTEPGDSTRNKERPSNRSHDSRNNPKSERGGECPTPLPLVGASHGRTDKREPNTV